MRSRSLNIGLLACTAAMTTAACDTSARPSQPQASSRPLAISPDAAVSVVEFSPDALSPTNGTLARPDLVMAPRAEVATAAVVLVPGTVTERAKVTIRQTLDDPEVLFFLEGEVIDVTTIVLPTRDPSRPLELATRSSIRVSSAWKAPSPSIVEIWNVGGDLDPDYPYGSYSRSSRNSGELYPNVGEILILSAMRDPIFNDGVERLRVRNGGLGAALLRGGSAEDAALGAYAREYLTSKYSSY